MKVMHVSENLSAVIMIQQLIRNPAHRSPDQIQTAMMTGCLQNEDRRPSIEDRKTKSSYNFRPFKLKAVVIIDNQA